MEIRTPREFADALDRLRRGAAKSYRQLEKDCDLPFTTIASWCKGRHLPQLSMRAELGRLLDALGIAVGTDQQPWFDGLVSARQRIGRSSAALNPYPGLRAFQPEDARWFRGRDQLTGQLVAALPGGSVAVVGPSGSGKSSLLRAGLAPALEQVQVITPGAEPLRMLEVVPATGVLVVDQFEELFTLCPAADRARFVDALLDREEPVVIGLRADFYAHAMEFPRLAGLLQDRQILVAPLTETQLRAAIVEPAREAGFDLDPGLLELLVRDTAKQPGGLPLLSHTLHSIVESWLKEGTSGSVIGVEHYLSAGGVNGAIAQTADLAYRSLNSGQRTVARNLFLRLVKVDDNAVDTRRRVRFDELFDGREDDEVDDIAEVFEVFVSHRLLIADNEVVEISHEALLGAWPLLQDWLAHDRVGYHIHGRLTVAARNWRDNDRQPDDLYQGGTLETALEWANSPGPHAALNPLEREFLAASADRRTELRAAARRRVRRRYQLLTLAVVMALAAVSAGLYARQVAATANQNNQLALSRDTADKADRLRDKDPALAAQLALAAYSFAPTAEAVSAVLDSSSRPLPARAVARDGTTLVMTSTAKLLVAGTDDGRVQLTVAGTGEAVAETRVAKAVAALACSNDDSLLAAGAQDGEVTIWRISDPANPVPLATLEAGPSRLFALAFSPDGRQLAAGSGDGTVRLWTLRGASAPVVLAGPAQAVKGVAFTPNGDSVVGGSDDGTVHVWPVIASGRPVVLRGPTSKIFAVAVAPDGRTVAAGTAAEHRVYTWDLTDPGAPPKQWTGPASWINTVAFSPDSKVLAAGSSDTLLWQWDLHSGQALRPLPHPKPLTGVEFRDEHTVLTLATDGITRTWTVPGPVLTGPNKAVFSASYDASGRTLLVGSGDNSLRLWNVADPHRPALARQQVVDDPGVPPLSGASALTGDGTTVIAGANDGGITLWNLDRPAEPVRLAVATATVQSIALSRDGRTIAVGSDDKTVHLVDISDRTHPKVTTSLTDATDIVYGVRFSPDGGLLAATSADTKGYLWDITDRTKPSLRTTVTGFGGPVYATAFSADGALVAFGSSDYSVRLIDLSRPEKPTTLPVPLVGPVGEVYELAFHPQRRELAISSTDRTIWLWNLDDPRKPAHFATLTTDDALLTIAFNPDGRGLAAGGRDRTVRIWNTDLAAVQKWICQTVGQPITPTEWAQFIPGEQYSSPCR